MREGLAALRQNARAVVRQQLARAGEQKFIFDRIAATSTAAGAVTQIAQTAQGDANGQRDGLKTTHKSLRFKYVVNNAGNSQGTCRVIIFKWFRDYNNAPTTPYVLYNSTGGANPDTNAVYNAVFADRYKILHDKMYVFGRDYAAGTVLASDNVIHQCSRNITLKGKCMWVDDVATHYEKGSIFVLFIGTNTNMSLIFNSIYKYTDN